MNKFDFRKNLFVCFVFGEYNLLIKQFSFCEFFSFLKPVFFLFNLFCLHLLLFPFEEAVIIAVILLSVWWPQIQHLQIFKHEEKSCAIMPLITYTFKLGWAGVV